VAEMNTHLENYLKSIYALSLEGEGAVSTNAIAGRLSMKASSVTDMLRKLDEKGYVRHQKYYGADLTTKGRKLAMEVVRKHRLWEMFLVQKLGYGWDEVHDIAEQLEHVQSETLIDKLDAYLGFPTHDPHGDPIPTREGKLPEMSLVPLTSLDHGKRAVVRAVKDHSSAFLRHLTMLGLEPGQKFQLLNRLEYDQTCILQVLPGKRSVQVSAATAENLLVQPV